MTRITTIPFNFTLAAAAEGYLRSWPLPAGTRLTHLYALGEPAPSQLLYIMLLPWYGGSVPAAGIPPGPTIFDDLIAAPYIRLGRIPTDMDLDITLKQDASILCYANNGNTTTQQCMVELTVALF